MNERTVNKGIVRSFTQSDGIVRSKGGVVRSFKIVQGVHGGIGLRSSVVARMVIGIDF